MPFPLLQVCCQSSPEAYLVGSSGHLTDGRRATFFLHTTSLAKDTRQTRWLLDVSSERDI